MIGEIGPAAMRATAATLVAAAYLGMCGAVMLRARGRRRQALQLAAALAPAPAGTEPTIETYWTLDWSRKTTLPYDEAKRHLRELIVDATRARYIEAYERISGLKFSDWIKP